MAQQTEVFRRHLHRRHRKKGWRCETEALPLLLTLSSGVQGFTTIHAGSARQALSRLRFVCQLADTGSELTLPALSALVSEAVDVVVHCARLDGSPRVTEVIAVEDLHVGPETVAYTTTSVWERPRREAALAWTGNLPIRAARALERSGYDVRALVDTAVAGHVDGRGWAAHVEPRTAERPTW